MNAYEQQQYALRDRRRDARYAQMAEAQRQATARNEARAARQATTTPVRTDDDTDEA